MGAVLFFTADGSNGYSAAATASVMVPPSTPVTEERYDDGAAAVSRLLNILLLAWLFGAQLGYAQTVEYIHTDALGSPVAVTDVNGSVIERSEYEPYGAMLNRLPEDRPGYTAHVADAATGLNYMQQRYYDSAIGRFLSVDPVTQMQTTEVTLTGIGTPTIILIGLWIQMVGTSAKRLRSSVPLLLGQSEM